MSKRKRKKTTELNTSESANVTPKESSELTPDQVAELMASYEDSPAVEAIKFAPVAEEPGEEVVVDEMPLESAIDFSEDDMVEIDLKAHCAPHR